MREKRRPQQPHRPRVPPPPPRPPRRPPSAPKAVPEPAPAAETRLLVPVADWPEDVTGYLAPGGFLEPLLEELGTDEDGRNRPLLAVHGRLVIVAGPARPAAWAQNVWYAPQRLAIESIGDAAAKLRAIQRNWALYAHGHYRRAALIEARLPPVSAKPLVFGDPVPAAPLGSWTLLDPATLLAAPGCSSPFRHGEVAFVEDRTAPPSRAYLKLWEALTLLSDHPRPGETCLDLGSSPGGWTWALQRLGVQVYSVDKARLDPGIEALPNVVYRQESAFALDPRAFGRIDWLFSDVICYPARLLRLVETWLEAATCRRFACTIKFQGGTDHETARRFAAIPGSRLLHLSHNKHELTWICLR